MLVRPPLNNNCIKVYISEQTIHNDRYFDQQKHKFVIRSWLLGNKKCFIFKKYHSRSLGIGPTNSLKYKSDNENLNN